MKKLRFGYWIAGLSLVMYGVVVSLPFKAKPLGDLDFHNQTRALAQTLWGAGDFGTLVINKAPGPVVYYAIPYFLAGPGASDDRLWMAGIAWSFFWMTFSLYLVWQAARIAGVELAGKVTVLVLLILPLHLYYSLGILAESQAFLGCCLFLWGATAAYYRGGGRVAWVAMSTGLLCMLLARPNSVLVLPLLAVVILVGDRMLGDLRLRAIRRGFVLTLAATVLALSVITVGIKQLPGNQRAGSQEGYLAYVMLIGRFQFREEPFDWRFWDGSNRADSRDYQNYQLMKQQIKSESVASGESSSAGNYRFVVNDMVRNPFTTLKQFVVRTVYGHVLQVSSVKPGSFGIGPLRGWWVFVLFHIVLNAFNALFLICAVVAIRRAWRSRNGLVYLLVVPWIALVLFHGVVYMEQRYLFPVRAILILLGTTVLVEYVNSIGLFPRVMRTLQE